jgi:TPR repeat protein
MQFLLSIGRVLPLFLGLITCLADDSLSDLIKKAEEGDADDQNTLGHKYNLGEEVPLDYAKALKWYRVAAEQGHAVAQYNLGLMYDVGHGCVFRPAQSKAGA